MTIDERIEWDLMEAVREVFSSHIGGALAGSNVVSRAVQVLSLSLVRASPTLVRSMVLLIMHRFYDQIG